MKEERLKVLYYGMDKESNPLEPVEMEIDNTLEAKQKLVEGWIEFVDLGRYEGPNVEAVVNEEGKYLFPPNRTLNTEDYVAGPFFVVGPPDDEGYSTSLTPEIIKQVKEFFRVEWFANL